MGRPMVLLSAKEIEKMRVAGRFAAELLDHLGSMLKPGITTQVLNDEAEKLTQARKAKSAPLGYHGFPRSICTSVNDVVCHGIPSKEQVLKDGDIINIDVTPKLDVRAEAPRVHDADVRDLQHRAAADAQVEGALQLAAVAYVDLGG